MSANPFLPLPMRIVNVTVENDASDLKTFELAFVSEADMSRFAFLPGQFAFISIMGVGEAPFGIASAPDEPLVKFTVKRIGSFTSALHELDVGAVVGLRGPYGNSYPFDFMRGKDIVIVSGGFSFTTLRSTIVYLLDPQRREDYGRIVCVYGARSPGELLYKEQLKKWEKSTAISLTLCADRVCGESWPCNEGLVPNILKQVSPSSGNAVALVCGPPVMIRFTHPVLEELGFKPDQVFLSLENRMKCGLGKCGRCNIGPKYVCKHGPVFSYAELLSLPPDY